MAGPGNQYTAQKQKVDVRRNTIDRVASKPICFWCQGTVGGGPDNGYGNAAYGGSMEHHVPLGRLNTCKYFD